VISTSLHMVGILDYWNTGILGKRDIADLRISK
jgi:hypothetical protein